MDYKNSKGQRIGWLQDCVFRKRVKRSKHLFKKGNAWGIDTGVVLSLLENGCKEIKIKDDDTGKIYSTTMEHWMDKSWELDLGHGKQQFMSIKEFITK